MAKMFTPAIKYNELAPFAPTNPLANATIASNIWTRLGLLVVTELSESASRAAPTCLMNSGLPAALQDAVQAARLGQRAAPVGLQGAVGDPAIANDIQNLLVEGNFARTLIEQEQRINQATELLERGPAIQALKTAFGISNGSDKVQPPRRSNSLRDRIRDANRDLPLPLQQAELLNWVNIQATTVAQGEFSAGLKKYVSETLNTGMRDGLFDVVLAPPAAPAAGAPWYNSVRIHLIYDRALRQLKPTATAAPPQGLPEPVVTERQANRNRLIWGSSLGAIGGVCWMFGAAGVPGASIGSLVFGGLAAVSGFTRSVSWKCGPTFSHTDFRERNYQSPDMTCAKATVGLATRFHTIRGDGVNVGRADELKLRQLYTAIQKVEGIRSQHAAASAEPGPDLSDAPLVAARWDRELRAIHDAETSRFAVPGVLLHSALPFSVSVSAWGPFVARWFGW